MKRQARARALFLCWLSIAGATVAGGQPGPPVSLAGTGFSVFFPIVTRARGVSTTFYTSLDVTNNLVTATTDVLFNYRSADGSLNKSGTLTTLGGFGNFHTDDFLQLLVTRGVLTQAQADSTFGTLVLTFANPAFTAGTEGSAVTRIYNYLTGNSGASVGLAYRAQVIRANGAHRLAAVITDTKLSSGGPTVVTNLGLANVGVDDSGNPIAASAIVTLSFFDPRLGIRVGSQPQYTLAPGQVVQINDVFTQFPMPSGTNSIFVIADGSTGATAPQIDGYISVKDTTSSDGSYFAMQPIPPGTTSAPTSKWYLSPLLQFTLNANPSASSSGGLQLCLSRMDWTTTLQGPLNGTSYAFNLGTQSSLGSSDPPNGRLVAEIIRKRGSTETVFASKTFDTTKTYAVQNAVIAGADFAGQAGDVVDLRVRIQQGLPCIAEYVGAGTDSFIMISP
ncbi:MAG: hypothetical protein AABO58_07120 [Acidobacteriota bacterium]